MAGLGDLFGANSTASQFLLWGVGYAIASSLMAPVLEQVRQEAFSVDPSVVLSPADLADMVVRNIKAQADAADQAQKSGINGGDFDALVAGAGEPPGLEFLLQAYRRGFIPYPGGDPGVPSVETGIRTSRIYDYWAPVIEQMLSVPISPADAVAAVLRGQIPAAQGQAEAYASGIDQARFQILLDTAGRPPSPEQLVELVRRSIIPMTGTGPDVLSFQQGIFEGDAKDKWEPIYERLADYIPPPRIVTTLERSNAITAAQAQQYYQDAGLSADLAAAYNKSILGEKLEGTKQLAQGVVLELYQAGAIDTAAATGYLNTLGYTNAQAEFLLSLYDLRQEVAALNRATNRIGQLYVKHKISRAGAINALGVLGVAGAHQDNLMSTWDEQLINEVQLPTIGEIGKAIHYGAITPEEGLVEAAKLGYQPFDAYVALSAAAEAPVGVKPPNVVTPPATV